MAPHFAVLADTGRTVVLLPLLPRPPRSQEEVAHLETLFSVAGLGDLTQTLVVMTCTMSAVTDTPCSTLHVQHVLVNTIGNYFNCVEIKNIYLFIYSFISTKPQKKNYIFNKWYLKP